MAIALGLHASARSSCQSRRTTSTQSTCANETLDPRSTLGSSADSEEVPQCEHQSRQRGSGDQDVFALAEGELSLRATSTTAERDAHTLPSGLSLHDRSDAVRMLEHEVARG